MSVFLIGYLNLPGLFVCFKISITWVILKIKNTGSKQGKKKNPGLYDSDTNHLTIWIHTPCPILSPVREPELKVWV